MSPSKYVPLNCTSKTWNTVCYSVSNKQKPSTIPSIKYNNSIWALVVQLVAKISKDIVSVQTEKFKFELNKFLELIHCRAQNAKLCHRSRKQHHHRPAISSLGSRNLPWCMVESLTRSWSRLSCCETTQSIQVSVFATS